MKNETKEFIIAVRDKESLSGFITRSSRIISKWINSHGIDNDEYLIDLKNIKREAILKVPSKGLNMSNLAAYRWVYEYKKGGLEDYESSQSGNGKNGNTKASGGTVQNQKVGEGKRDKKSTDLRDPQ